MKFVIGYQGREGSNSHRAALLMVGRTLEQAVQLRPMGQAKHVLTALAEKQLDYAVFAFATDARGAVEETKQACKDISLTAIDHCHLDIAHHLYVAQNFDYNHSVSIIASHSEALFECRNNLARQFPHAAQQSMPDTATAALALSGGELPLDAAVLCSAQAAEYYGLKLLCENIQDLAFNGTDFLLVRLA